MFVMVFKMFYDAGDVYEDDDGDAIDFDRTRCTVQKHLFNALYTLIKSNRINNGDVTDISSSASHPHARKIYMTSN